MSHDVPCILSATFALMLVTQQLARAQAVHATLLGEFTDPSGAVIPGAKVTLTETNTSTSRSDTANSSGNFTFADIPPGTYAVVVEAPGFKKDVHQNIGVTINTSTRVDVQVLGAAYKFFQNTALNARDFFDTKVGAIRYNYFGGNIGGPIVKDKLFYFGGFQVTCSFQTKSIRSRPDCSRFFRRRMRPGQTAQTITSRCCPS